MIGQGLCAEGRSYFQNEPALNSDAISDKKKRTQKRKG